MTRPARVAAMAAALLDLPESPYTQETALAAAADLEALLDVFLQHTPLSELLAPRRLETLRRADEIVING